MKPIWIFRHIQCEGPGFLGQVLQNNNIDYEIFAIDQGTQVPNSPSGSSGLIFMGGPMSANDSDTWIQQEIQLIRQAATDNVPLLGHCLGGQLISKALGATITANPVKEIGWHAVEKFENLETQQWFGHVATPIELFHWHGETFELPTGATPLLHSRHCKNQAYSKGNILALQCHIEMLPEMVSEWAMDYQEEIQCPSESVQSKEQMLTNIEQRIDIAQGLAQCVYTEWLRRAGFG